FSEKVYSGEPMERRRNRFDEFSRHEVYDRASVVLELFSSSVAEHPVVTADPTLSAEAQKTIDAIYQFYSISAPKLMAPATTKRGTGRRTRTGKKTGRRG